MVNTLTIGSYIVIILLLVGIVLWIYRRGKAEGASQQKAEDEEIINEWLKENASDIYNGHIGINAFRVSSDDAWGSKDSGARVEIRVVSDREADGAGNAGGDSD